MPRTLKSPVPTEKSTKQEILSAYRELLGEVSTGAEETLPIDDGKILDSATKETVEKIFTDLSKLKISASATISSLADQLTLEAERLATLRKAIALLQKELEETQKIKVTAGMLLRMVELQKQKEEEFEKEMTAKRAAWAFEQKEYEEQMKRDRSRNEEEYAYNQSLEKKRDEDDRTQAQRAFSQEMGEKKDELLKEKKELEELRRRVAQIPVEIDKATKDAVTKAVAEVRKDTNTASQMAKQHAESELALAQASVASLEQTVKSQVTEITRLNNQIVEASRQVKDIAVAVAEGQRRDSLQPGTGKIS